MTHRPAAHVCGALQVGAIGNVLPGALNVMQRVSICIRRSFFTSGTSCAAARRTTTGVVGAPPGPRVAACDVRASTVTSAFAPAAPVRRSSFGSAVGFAAPIATVSSENALPSTVATM